MEYLREYIGRVMRKEKGGIVSFFLFIVSVFYNILQRGRVFLYEKGFLKAEMLGVRVISVGNITVGGTGKTPAVIAIAQAAKEKAFKVTVLTRGYRGKAKGISPVSDGSRVLLSCRDAGDEPYLMARKLNGIPVVKGNDRYFSAKFAMDRFGSDIFILDDGYQHIKMHRDVNILLIDTTDPFGNGYLIPRGILREPLRAIKRADIIVLTKADLSKMNEEIVKKVRRYNPSAPIFFSYYRLLDLVNIKGDLMSLEDIKDKSLFLFSGLANHSSFRLLLERKGARVTGELTYPDHFYYSKKDLDEIKEKAGFSGADMIVTTEKDIVRIPDSGLKTQDSRLETQVWALRIEFVVEDRANWESLLFPERSSIGGNN